MHTVDGTLKSINRRIILTKSVGLEHAGKAHKLSVPSPVQYATAYHPSLAQQHHANTL